MTDWTSVDDATAYAHDLLAGDRVRLRPLSEADLPDLETWWAEPTLAVLQQDVVRPRPSGSVVDQFRLWSANDSYGSAGFCVTRRDDGALLGHVTLFGADVKNRAATLAIVLGPDHTGQGFGTEAVRVMVRYGFSEMGLHRIGLQTYGFNDRAIAVYGKVGFREEGRRREAVFHDGAFYDEVQMGLLEREWRASR